MSDTPENLAGALAAFQANLPRIGKDNRATVKSDKGQYSYTYADLAEIATTVLPALAVHGLSWSAMPTVDPEGRMVLHYKLMHSSGEELHGSYPLPAPNTPPQQMGSAITYARRYTLCAVTGVAPDEDDDGAAATATPPQRQEPQQERPARLSDEDRRAQVEELFTLAMKADSYDEARVAWNASKHHPGSRDDVARLLASEDREALGVDEGPIELVDLAKAVGGYISKHGHGPRAQPEVSEAEMAAEHDADQQTEGQAGDGVAS